MIIARHQPGALRRKAAPDIGAPIREAEALGRTVDKALAVAESAKSRHDKYAADKATAEMTSTAHRLELENAQKPFYDASEIPDDIGVRKTEVVTGPDGEKEEIDRTNIPAYEVFPRILDSTMQGHIDSNADNLPRSVRNNWKLNAEAVKGRMNQAAMLNMERQQISQIRTDQDANFKEAMIQRDYTTAMIIAGSYSGSNSEKQAYRNVVAKSKESGDYRDQMAEDNIKGMTQSLAYLQQKDYSGRLLPRERDTMVTALKSRLSQLNSRGRAERESKYVRLKNSVDRSVSALENGYALDPDELIRLGARLSDAHALAPEGTLAAHKVKWDEAMQDAGDTNAFARLSAPSREEILAQLPTDTGDQVNRRDKYSRLNDNVSKLLDKDSMTFAEQVGLVEVNDLEPDNLVNGLAERLRLNTQIEATYGHSAGMLREGEADFINNQISDMPVQDRLQFFAQVQTALGGESTKLYQQIDPNGINPNMSAGILATQGRARAGQYLLQGNQFGKDSPTAVPSRTEIRDGYVDNVGGTFAALSSEQKRSMSGITDIYNGLSQESGDVSGVFDQGRFDLAVEMYTGGIGEVGDSKIQMPDGWTQRELDSHLTRYASSNWVSEGGVKGYEHSYDELTQDIRSGKVSLIQNGLNRFLLYSNIVGTQLQTPAGGAAMFSFKKDAKLKKIGRRRR